MGIILSPATSADKNLGSNTFSTSLQCKHSTDPGSTSPWNSCRLFITYAWGFQNDTRGKVLCSHAIIAFICCTGTNKYARGQGKKNEAAQQFRPYFLWLPENLIDLFCLIHTFCTVHAKERSTISYVHICEQLSTFSCLLAVKQLINCFQMWFIK